ncbi:hypothetical protein [Inquilinus limosus]|uniref:Uncharacterized protein n=1 Tax=Inquilinus limosus TaxID=171674 RepID=A0A211ZQ93_9PROT|nr:hypothetical protein [Inquilinus limosus]OWJ67435.1 hypothetical protein BWR60_09520 [Inquilinus limosus]
MTPELAAKRASATGGGVDAWRDQVGGTVLGALYRRGLLAHHEKEAPGLATGRYLAGLDYADLMDRVGRQIAAPRGMAQKPQGRSLSAENAEGFARTMAQYRETLDALGRLDFRCRIALSLACPDPAADVDALLPKAVAAAPLVREALDALVRSAPRIKAVGRSAVEAMKEAA